MASTEHVIGIDLGTTNSVVAAVVGAEVHVIPDESGARTQASVVAFLPDGSVLVGNEARREAITDPVHSISSAKRLIGRPYASAEVKQAQLHFPCPVVRGPSGEAQFEVRAGRYGPAEIAGMVVRRMKDISARYLKGAVGAAVITVPANFNDTQRQMTKLAGQLAGLDVLRVINEPTAAALAYGYGQDLDARVVVYDFGGGTFDVTVLDIRDNVFEVIATAGDTYLGGDDFDQRMARYMTLAFHQQTGISLEEDVMARTRLRQVGEKLKIELSQKERALVHVRELAHDASGAPLDLKFQISRADFHERTQDLVQRSFLVCDEAMRIAKVSPADIDAVVLVGGTTRMPLVRQMVAEYFGREPLTDINPDEVVAVGASIQAAALSVDPFAPDAAAQPLLLDVTPLSLGVQTVSGFVDILIPRNAAIPCEQTRVFTTTVDNQTAVRVQIFQGESRVAAENTKLGELELYGLRAAPRGQVAIEVTFEIDPDGLVLVTARDQETGIEQATRIETFAGYSPAQMQQLIERGI